MKQTWNKPIDKHTDWGGDRSTEGLPVSGQYVQKFIKDTLEEKGGYFHSNSDEGVCYVFSDKEAYDTYIDTGEGEPIGQFRIPIIDVDDRYYISTNIKDEEKYKTVLASTTPKTITFNPTLKSRVDNSSIPSILYWTLVVGTYTLTGTCQSGDVVTTQDLSDYVHTGGNNYLLTIVAPSTYDSAQSRIDGTLTVINLSFEVTEFNYQQIQNAELSISYSVHSQAPVYVQFIIDNQYNEDNIFYHENSASVHTTKTVDISGLNNGVHTLQARAYISGSGTDFHFSNSYYYEFIVGSVSSNTALISTPFKTIATYPEYVDYTLRFTIEQYTNLMFDYVIQNPNQTLVDLTFTLDNEQISSRAGVDSGIVYSFQYPPTTYGRDKTVQILINNTVVKEFLVTITKSQYDVLKITEGLVFELEAKGKSNSDADKDNWGILRPANFHNFTFSGRKGWDTERGALSIADGAYITIPNNMFSLFPTNLENTGRTIELTFETFNVKDEDAVIFSCKDQTNVAKLEMTSTSATLNGNTVDPISEVIKTSLNTKFGDGVKLNLFFIINPKQASSDSGVYPGFTFIANNGVYERAVFYSGDTFSNTGDIIIGDENGSCGMYLYNMKVYNRALSEDEIINNYALDTDDIQNIMTRNSVYEAGSHTFSTEILEQRTPVMYITCPRILELFADKDRNSKMTVLADLMYHDAKNPEFNFEAHNIGLRKLGTSTYTAPIPNLRPYLNKQPDGTDKNLYPISVTGDRVIQKGTKFYYSFKDAAQYVDVWTLKADPAESSMTHNTGVARLWGNALKGFSVDESDIIENEFLTQQELANVNSSNATDLTGLSSGRKGLTKAQADVLRYNEEYPNDLYNYDVRTSVDGFPIVMFYRLSESLPWVFMGLYNFNNDKSTESVYGWFTSEPTEHSEFVNEDAECWEFRENTFNVTLFKKNPGQTSEQTFNDPTTGVFKGFEARYPDGSTDTAALWRIYNWLSNVSQEDFNTEMYDYIDVWKVAAYYIYCMRFGAVDQMVKNAMFCTDDGLHWYFINYDNDTILGVKNDGSLAYNYDIDRDTVDHEVEEGDAPYAFQGHDSNLWNRLVANETFLKVVKIVDKALSASLISYDSCIDMFNVKQASSWCERIYNYNGEYKYLLPYLEGDTSYLKNLQGSRMSHRSWWLKNRFDIYDSMWQSGNYYQKVFRFLTDSPDGNAHIKVTSANSNAKFGWGIVQHPYYQTADTVPYGTTVSFDNYNTAVGGAGLSVSDAVVIYEAHNALKIDLSEFNAITEVRLEAPFAGNNKLESLNLSGNTYLANSLDLSTIPNLTELILTNCPRVSITNLNALQDLTVFNAAGTTLTEFVPADGVILSNVVLPSTITRLELNNATIGTFSQNSTVNINTLVLNNVAWNDEYNFVMNVLNSHTTSTLQNLTMSLRNINWQLTDSEFDAFLDKYAQIEDRSNLILTGRITLDTIDQELYDKTISILGIEVFQTGGQLVVDCTSTVDLINTIEALDLGDSATLRWIHFPLSVFDTNNTRYTIPGVTPIVEDGKNVYVTQAAKVYEETGVIEALVDNTLTTNTTLSITCINGLIRYNTSVTINRCVVPNCVYIDGRGVYASEGYSYDTTLNFVNFYTVKSYMFLYVFVEEENDTIDNNSYMDTYTVWNNKKTNDAMILNVEVKIESYDDPTVTIDPTIAEVLLDTTNKRIRLLINSISETADGYKLRLYITRTDGVVYSCTWNYFISHVTKITFARQIAMTRGPKTSTTIDFMYNQGWVQDNQIVYVEELEAITDLDLVESNGFLDVYINHNETCDMSFLLYMTGITTIPQDCFVHHTTVGSSTRDNNPTHSSIFLNIIFPDLITQIDDYAFCGVYINSRIYIPNSVIRVGKYAFLNAIGSGYHASNARGDVTFGSGISILDDYAFSECFRVQDSGIVIPDTVTQFGTNVLFVGTVKGTIVVDCNLPNRTENNPVFTILDTSGNTAIIINSTSIGNYAIKTWGISVLLSSSILKLGNYWLNNILIDSIFNGSFGDENYNYLSRNTLSYIKIGDGLYNNLILPNSLTSIGEGAFRRTATTNIVFPSNSTFVTIPERVLDTCPLLESVTIPEQITSISNYAFASCYGIREFVFHPTVSPDMTLQAFADDVHFSAVSLFSGVGNRWAVARVEVQDTSNIYSGLLDVHTRISNLGSVTSYDSTVLGVIRIPANSTGYTNTGSNTTAIEYLCDMDTQFHFGTYLADGSLSCYQSGSTPATYDKSFILDLTL